MAKAELLNLGKIYPSDFLKPGEKPRCGPVELKLVMDDSKMVTLEKTAPKDVMWGKYWYRSGINKTMRDELRSIVESIVSVTQLKKNDLWLDIACNDGTLLSFVPEEMIRVGIDPAEDSFIQQSTNHADQIVQDYFSAEAYRGTAFGKQKAKIITAIAMFYDLTKPEKFLFDVLDIMDDDGLFVLQLSYTPLMLHQLAFDNICHEHAAYYNLFTLQDLLWNCGFEIMDCQLNEVNGGSFRVYAMKKKGNKRLFGTQAYRDVSKFRIDSLLAHERQQGANAEDIWFCFSEELKALKKVVVDFITVEKKNGKSIWAYGACHDIMTNLVTKYGIKSIEKVTKSDIVYTLNVKTKKIEESPIDEILKYYYEGDMIHFNGKRVDQVVTPNHQVLFETYHSDELRFESADKISKRSMFYIPKSGWDGKNESKFDIRRFVDQKKYSKKCRIIDNVFNTTDFLYITGIFMGDGYVCGRNQGYSINLCIPKKDKARKKTIRTLKKMNLSFREYDTEIQVASIALFTIFKNCGTALNKRLPSWASEYSPKYLKHLLDGLVDSDGWYERSGRKKFCSSSYGLIKDVCEISLKMGYFPSITKRKKRDKPPKIKGREIPNNDAYIVNICTNHTGSHSNKKLGYIGNVWCLSVKNKNFLVERNGKISFSGNSTKGNTLLQYFELDNKMIDGIADRNPDKWGLRTVGTNIEIHSEDKMREAKPDYLLILPWHFVQEFIGREKEYLQNGGRFIVPCPQFEIIEL